MNTEASTEIIDHLPKIGEKVIVVDSNGIGSLATIIGESRCHELAPKLFRGYLQLPLYKGEYPENENIRCFQFDNGPVNGYLASFCIMRFNKMGGGYEFNKNVRKVS
jgi:hypothetical protein